MHQQGFSLIELLMGLTIVGIVLYWVCPALAAFSESARREEAAKSIMGGIRNARTLAMTRNQTVVIHGIHGDWAQGWRIILDVSGKGAADHDNPLIAEHANSGGGGPIMGNWWVRRYIRFSSLGMPLMPERAFQAGTLHLCDAREPVSQLQIVLAPSGRVSLLSEKTEQALCER
ncbi:hypothetical protein D3C73_883790 [compost metagenome]